MVNAEYRELADEGARLLAQIEQREATLAARQLAEQQARAAELEAQREKVQYAAADGVETFALDRPGRKICGVCSTSTPNSHRYALLSRGAEIQLLPPIPLLSGHQAGAIGEITLIRRSARELYCEARIFDNEVGDYAWSLIDSGKLTSFSAAADPASMHLQGEVDGIKFYDQWRLLEVSLCESGANPDCCDVVQIVGALVRIRSRKAVAAKTADAPTPPLVEVSTVTPIRDKNGKITTMITVKKIADALDRLEVTTSTPVWDAPGKLREMIVVKKLVEATPELTELSDYASTVQKRLNELLAK